MPTSRTEKAELERTDAEERGFAPRPGCEPRGGLGRAAGPRPTTGPSPTACPGLPAGPGLDTGPSPSLEAGPSAGADDEMRLVIGLDAARMAEICGRAAGQIQAADRLLDGGHVEEALRIYRGEVLPLYHALAKLPPRGVLMHKIAEAMARLSEGGGAD